MLAAWTDPDLREICLLRLKLALNVWVVDRCEGLLQDGSKVAVKVPFAKLPRVGLREMIVSHAKCHGVHAKNLGIFDSIQLIYSLSG